MGARRVTEQALGKLAGLSQPAVNRLKAGRTEPLVSTALRIARALDVRVEEIWGES